MSDQTLAPLRAARPKATEPQPEQPVHNQPLPPSHPVPATKSEQLTHRGPGRPPKPDELTTIHAIGGLLKPFEHDTRVKILETLLALT